MPAIDSNGELTGGNTGDIRIRFFEEVVPACPDLIFLLLTKRPSLINKYVPEHWLDSQPDNIWYGASVVDYKSLIDVSRHLAKVRGKKFVSIEPLLEPVSLRYWMGPLPNWIIVGGESGPKRRPFKACWARTLRNECDDRNIPFFMKQMDKVEPIPEDLLIRQLPKQFTDATNPVFRY